MSNQHQWDELDPYGGEMPLWAGTVAPSPSTLRALDPDTYLVRVLPDTLYVEHYRSRDAIKGRGDPGRHLLAALRASDKNDPSGLVFKNVPQWAKSFAAVEAHERDHVRRLLGTTFGLLGHALRSQSLVGVRTSIIEQVAACGKLQLPLSVASDRSARVSDPNSERVYIARQLHRAIEDKLPTKVLRQVEAGFAGWTAEGCVYHESELPGDPEFATLAIQNYRTARWLTARHLLELFGVTEQGNRLLGVGSPIDEVVNLVSDLEPTYRLVQLVWESSIPRKKDTSRSTAPHTRPGELYLGMYRLLPLELFVAADLALWPPFAPTGFISETGELSWTDICPAFRFAKVVHTFKRLGLQTQPWPDGSLDEVVPEIQQRLCHELNWPTPADLAKRWLDHLASRHTDWFVDASIGGFRYETMMQLLQLRHDRPGSVIVNNIDYGKIGVGRTPGWITHEATGRTPMTLAPEAQRQATEFWLGVYSLLPALHADDANHRLAYLRSCSKAFQEHCIHAFDAWGLASEQWPSDQFLRQATALLRL